MAALSMDISSRSAFSTLPLSTSRKSSATSTRKSLIIVQASATHNSSSAADLRSDGKKIAAALAAAAIIGSAPIVAADIASADVSGLTKCKDSAAFAKREKKSIKKLETRLKLYAEDSAPALAINATIEKTKKRFKNYGEAGLLCGADGLPHLIVDGDQEHLGEFVYPGLLFLYIAGWIGWVGRSYLNTIKVTEAKPTMREIIIDVPLATSLMWRGFTWPLAAISEFRNGTLIEDDANITVSPR